MAFFSRKGLAVPALPTEAGSGSVTDAAAVMLEMDAVPEVPVVTVRAPSMATAPKYADAVAQLRSAAQAARVAEPSAAADDGGCSARPTTALTATATTAQTEQDSSGTVEAAAEDESRFDYVVDRTYGVEV